MKVREIIQIPWEKLGPHVCCTLKILQIEFYGLADYTGR